MNQVGERSRSNWSGEGGTERRERGAGARAPGDVREEYNRRGGQPGAAGCADLTAAASSSAGSLTPDTEHPLLSPETPTKPGGSPPAGAHVVRNCWHYIFSNVYMLRDSRSKLILSEKNTDIKSTYYPKQPFFKFKSRMSYIKSVLRL